MKISFNIEPHEGKMYVKANYSSKEIITPHFYLNRDFIIKSLIYDNVEIKENVKIIKLKLFGGYEVNKVEIPKFSENMSIEYIGTLTGKTGCCPYVREQITSQFTFIRFETFCFPIFFYDDWNSFNLTGVTCSDIEVIVPIGYIVIGTEIESSKDILCDKEIYRFHSNNITNEFFSCSIAKYNLIETSVGNFYFFNTIGKSKKDEIKGIMKTSHEYLNKHFGYRDISSNIKYATIPDGFGSFARFGVVFIQESAFDSFQGLNQIIHEFIHLGWNAKADEKTQRARFFDEAFTCYFEMRVMQYVDKNNYDKYVSNFISIYRKKILEEGYKIIPISKFAEYKYGDLSYSIGALCLHELCMLVGEEIFDNATTKFLNKYRDKIVDLDAFCQEYINLCGIKNKKSISSFFDDWIYSCRGIYKFLD